MPRPPKRFHEFVGQTRVIGYLMKLVNGAKALGIAAHSLLLSARPGQGKSALAEALAREYGSKFHRFIAGKGVTVKTLCEQLLQLAFGDIYFIDESQSLDRDAQQALFIALDQRKTFKHTDTGRVDRSALVSVADFCLILATSEEGQILPALRDRIEIVQFEPYTIHELKAIAERVAAQEEVAITPQAARYLAERSQGSPRQIELAIGLLKSYWSDVVTSTDGSVDLPLMRDFLEERGIDDRGLRPRQREYLRVLAATPRQTSSVEHLASRLGCDLRYLRRDVEPFLIDCGFIEITTSRGRRLTEAGAAVVREMTEESNGNEAGGVDR